MRATPKGMARAAMDSRPTPVADDVMEVPCQADHSATRSNRVVTFASSDPTTSTQPRQSKCHSVFVDISSVCTVDGLQGCEFVFGDVSSIDCCYAKNDHGLNTLSRRAVNTYTDLPQPGPVRFQHAFLPPQSARNMYSSWCFIATACASEQRAALEYMMKYVCKLMDCAFFCCDLQVPEVVPASEGMKKSPWRAKSQVLDRRLKVVREGTQNNGTVWTSCELLNFVVHVDKALPPDHLVPFVTYCSKYPSIIKFVDTPFQRGSIHLNHLNQLTGSTATNAMTQVPLQPPVLSAAVTGADTHAADASPGEDLTPRNLAGKRKSKKRSSVDTQRNPMKKRKSRRP